MVIIGLTGSIGMGKSTTAKLFRKLGVPVHDADATVHNLLSNSGKAVQDISFYFPEVLKHGAVDRIALGEIVFSDPLALKKLEDILHPLVLEREKNFLKSAFCKNSSLVVLDIPLLFETEGYKRCDAITVVTAPKFLQKQRVLSRPFMTEKKFFDILDLQISDNDKCFNADFLVPTGLGISFSFRIVKNIIRVARKIPAKAWRKPKK